MKFAEFIKSELKGWGKFERVFFPLEILFIIVLSFLINDSKIALVSAVCGILYTILAGKGKISCYAFGLSGTLCYSYLSFANRLWGNLALYLLFYFPIQDINTALTPCLRFLKFREESTGIHHTLCFE